MVNLTPDKLTDDQIYRLKSAGVIEPTKTKVGFNGQKLTKWQFENFVINQSVVDIGKGDHIVDMKTGLRSDGVFVLRVLAKILKVGGSFGGMHKMNRKELTWRILQHERAHEKFTVKVYEGDDTNSVMCKYCFKFSDDNYCSLLTKQYEEKLGMTFSEAGMHPCNSHTQCIHTGFRGESYTEDCPLGGVSSGGRIKRDTCKDNRCVICKTTNGENNG